MYSRAKKEAFDKVGPSPAVQAVLADPPILGDEKESDYWNLLRDLGESVGAEDAADWLLAESACLVGWQLRQLRNARTQLLSHEVAASHASQEADRITAAWRRGLRAKYRNAYDAESDTKKREKLRNLYQEWTGSLMPYQGANQDVAVARLAKMLDYPERPDLDSIRAELPSDTAEIIARAFRSHEDLNEAIAREEARFRLILIELDRRHIASAKLQAVKEMSFGGSNDKGDLEQRTKALPASQSKPRKAA